MFFINIRAIFRGVFEYIIIVIYICKEQRLHDPAGSELRDISIKALARRVVFFSISRGRFFRPLLFARPVLLGS